MDTYIPTAMMRWSDREREEDECAQKPEQGLARGRDFPTGFNGLGFVQLRPFNLCLKVFNYIVEFNLGPMQPS